MIFLDTETTGLIKNSMLPLDKQPRIIEIGCIREPVIKDRPTYFETVFCPGAKLDKKITEITGLTDDDLSDAPEFSEHAYDLADFFRGEKTMVAHNMPFDFQMLLFELRRESMEYKFPWPSIRIDTIQIAKQFYNGKYMKLIALYEDLIGPYKQQHRAIDDVKMLIEVYHALMAKQICSYGPM